MKIKPRYRSMLATDIKPGMRVYSVLLGECFTVEAAVRISGDRVVFTEDSFTLTVLAGSRRWVEVRP